MQDNKPNNQSLDDDILQCKADLREVFKTMGLTGSDNVVVPLGSDASPGTIESLEADDIFLEAELLEKSDLNNSITDDFLLPDADEQAVSPKPEPTEAQPPSLACPAVPIEPKADTITTEKDTQIDQLRQQLESMKTQRSQLEAKGQELLQKLQRTSRESDSLKFQLAQEKNTREKLQKDAADIQKELQVKSQELGQQTERLGFLEKQLQNAVVLERAKSHFQQEAQALSAQNQQLAAEIVKLKSQRDSLHKTDQHVQTLREELQAADKALSEKEEALRQMQETLTALKEELSLHQQREADLLGKLEQNERSLADLK